MKGFLLCILVFFLQFPRSYAQVNLNNGLIAFYPFNGNANDASPGGLNGVVQNGAQLTSDRFGNANSAYQFDGIDDVILVHDNGILSPPTLSIAYYFSTTSTAHQICIGKINYTDGNGATYNSGLNVNNASNIWFNLSSPTSSCFLQIPGTEFYPSVAPPAVSLDDWHCVVNTFENGNEKIYLDGVLVSNEILPFTTSKYCTNTDFLIGSWWSGDLRPFKGKLDEIRMYNRALNEDEVHALCLATPLTDYTINDYTPVVDYDPCKNTLQVSDASKFNVGDTVVLMQMKGAKIDSTESDKFGNITDYKNTGNYEFNIIKQKLGNSLDLKNFISRTYDVADGKVQLIRVPYFINYTVPQGNNLTCLPWDGEKGGVLVLNVQNSLQLDGSIDVSGKGFLGGRGVNTNLLVTNCNQNNYNYPSGSVLAALKGESITSIGSQIASGKGSPANGGGGGLDHNSGGGGGSNGGTGGFGGYQLEACTNSAFDNRGIGGKKLDYGSTLQKVFLGGGGGAGHCNNQSFNATGGTGGGIVIIQTNQINNALNSIINANGANAVECDPTLSTGCHDASGGGGGGGTILLAVNSIQNTLPINSHGGKGGNLNVFDNPIGEGRIGPGGGGGGGVVSFNGALPQTNALISVTGGLNGTIPLDNNNPWGASPGKDGLQLANLSLQIDNTLFKLNIDSVKIQDVQTNCSSFDFKGLGYTNVSTITSWNWEFGDGNKSSSQNEIHAYNTTGQYQVILKGSDVKGCFLSDTVVLSVTPLILTKSNDTLICKNSSVQLLVAGGLSYTWSPQNSLNNIVISNPVATPLATTTYLVQAKGLNNCTNVDSIKISVRAEPVFSISDDTQICQNNNSVQLVAGGGDTYIWEPGLGLSDINAPNPTALPANTTTYSVLVTDTVCRIFSTLVTTITVAPTPIIVAKKSNDIDCSLGSSQLTVSGASSYTWTPAESLTNPNISNPVATPVVPTTYLVKGTNSAGCSNFDSVLVDVKAINKGQFLMPSAFTPNNDGLNDCFGARYWGYITDFDFSIFNRWGERVFNTKNPGECWNGLYKGNPQKADVYVYIIKAKSFCQSQVFRKGTVALIR